MKLPVPPNYSIPEDIEDGQSFEELVTFRLEGTSLVPTMLAGVEIPMEDSEDEDMATEEMATEEEAAMAGPMSGMGERIMGMA
jgi:mannose/fructose/N-acetylgalactosamine-specific phosphotransferase system component IID